MKSSPWHHEELQKKSYHMALPDPILWEKKRYKKTCKEKLWTCNYPIRSIEVVSLRRKANRWEGQEVHLFPCCVHFGILGLLWLSVGCPKKTKSLNFGMPLLPQLLIGKMSHQKQIQHYPSTTFWHPFLVSHRNNNGEIDQEFNLVITFDWGVLFDASYLFEARSVRGAPPTKNWGAFCLSIISNLFFVDFGGLGAPSLRCPT